MRASPHRTEVLWHVPRSRLNLRTRIRQRLLRQQMRLRLTIALLKEATECRNDLTLVRESLRLAEIQWRVARSLSFVNPRSQCVRITSIDEGEKSAYATILRFPPSIGSGPPPIRVNFQSVRSAITLRMGSKKRLRLSIHLCIALESV